MINDLYNGQIKSCKKCNISKLEANKCKFIYGSTINAEIIWIAQNPGYIIEKKTIGIFPIELNNNKQQDKFTKFLYDNNIYQKSYFTNLVKCSTLNNIQPKIGEIKNCFIFILQEIDYIKPNIIITLGKVSENIINKLQQFIKEKTNCNFKLYNLQHPTYIYSYKPQLINEFQNKILNICPK